MGDELIFQGLILYDFVFAKRTKLSDSGNSVNSLPCELQNKNEGSFAKW